MLSKIKNFILRIKCKRLYKTLPAHVKLQLWLEFNQPKIDESYNEILKRIFEEKKCPTVKQKNM